MKRKTGIRNPQAFAPRKPVASAESKPLPHELLLQASRGEPIGGTVPTLEQRLAAARQAAPYYAARLKPKMDDENKGDLVVMVQRFAGDPVGEETARYPLRPTSS